MSTVAPTPAKKGAPAWILYAFIGFMLILAIIIGVRRYKANHPPISPSVERSAVSNETLPAQYTKPYRLIKDSVIRVYIPLGYTTNCSSGGKKYYKQPQNGIKTIRGDGGNYNDGNGFAYFDLSFYEEEIEVIVEFTKQ